MILRCRVMVCYAQLPIWRRCIIMCERMLAARMWLQCISSPKRHKKAPAAQSTARPV
jgi:hypothetical protein